MNTRKPFSNRAGRAIGPRQCGMSLIELMIAMTVTLIAAGSLTYAVRSALAGWEAMERRELLLHGATLAVDRMAAAVNRAGTVLVPQPDVPVRDVLAVPGMLDNDGDGLVDEDVGQDIHNDTQSGIAGLDDDGDGLVDEDLMGDDDEDGRTNEELFNGLDDDGDGLVDEDLMSDITNDAKAGYAATDDNRDGFVDNGAGAADDDEDGSGDEDWLDPVVFTLSGTLLLERRAMKAGGYRESVLAERVTAFEAQRLTGPGNRCLVRISLELDDGQGRRLALTTHAFPRNRAYWNSGSMRYYEPQQ